MVLTAFFDPRAVQAARPAGFAPRPLGSSGAPWLLALQDEAVDAGDDQHADGKQQSDRSRVARMVLLNAEPVNQKYRRDGLVIRASAAGQEIGLGEEVSPCDDGGDDDQQGCRPKSWHGHREKARDRAGAVNP